MTSAASATALQHSPPQAFSALDRQHMQHALELAQLALYRASPNPRVGCVMAQGERVVGVGATQIVGGAHAEIEALRDATTQGERVAGATVYVTLEPCSHHGRTPPCVQALLAARPARVVCATLDPNPRVNGQGVSLLRAAGIQVDIGLLHDEAVEINAGFIKRMQQGLPWLRLKVACSVDGFTALPSGVSQWITSSAARADGHHFRAKACAVLTGLGTLKVDDPQLTVRHVSTPRQPLRVLVDAALQAPSAAQLFAQARSLPVLVLCAPLHDAAAKRRRLALEALGVQVVEITPLATTMPAMPAEAEPDTTHVDLHAALQELARREVNELHVEAGAGLNGAWLATGLVDEWLIYQSPRFLGEGFGLARLSPPVTPQDAALWRIHDACTLGDDVRLILRRPNATPLALP